jgi:hypothetical protein
MKQFKFFQKPVKDNLTMFDGQTRASASFVPNELPPLHLWDTPQGHNGRRRLYFTDHQEYQRQRQIREDLRTALRTNALTQEEMLRVRAQTFERMRNTNDDMERYFIENGFRDLNDNRINPPLITKPKLSLYRRFLNELMDDEKPHKLILAVLSILFVITLWVHYYTQR